MNPLLAAIAVHRAMQALERQGMYVEALKARILRNRLLTDARAYYNLNRAMGWKTSSLAISTQGANYV